MAIKEVSTISPKRGRPPKDNARTESLQLRLTKDTMQKLAESARVLGTTRTAVVEKGIDKIAEETLGK